MRPRHDPLPKVPAGYSPARKSAQGALLERIRALFRRGGKGKLQGGGEPCPVEPNRPLDLSGGAAAALEFGN